jgi:hypothetical protein
MIEKTIVCPDRVRKIDGSFAFIEHRFLREGFWNTLSHHELLLYFFLILAADRHGLSFYAYDKICTLVRISVDEYLLARNALMDKDLIAFDGRMFQVLSLPQSANIAPPEPLTTKQDREEHDPATIHQLIRRSLGD